MNPEGWIAAATALVVAAIMLPIVRSLAGRTNLYDSVGLLKIHTQPIPRLGGIALTVSLAAGVLLSGISIGPSFAGLSLALATIWAAGLVDDLRGLPAMVRLVAQMVAALLLWHAGSRLSLFAITGLDLVVTCVFVGVFVNAFNMLDGADGLAGGVAAVIALGYALLFSGAPTSLGGIVAWSTLGSCLAFLLFNFPPAKIFMGDSGSMVLGLVIALLSLDFYRGDNGLHRLLVPFIFAGLPLLDALFAVLRRLLHGASPFAGDRRHFYDLLLQRGWSPRRVALCSYAATAVLVFVGWLCNRREWTFSIFFLLLVAYVLIAVQLGSLRYGSVSPDMDGKPQ